MGRMKKEQVEWTGMPASEGALNEIKSAILQTHPCLTAIETEKGNIVDIFGELKEKYGIPKRVFNALMKFSYYGNAAVQFQKDNELQQAWEALEKVN